ncbi:conjugative transfer signal peptidase TraF [Devosia neptuniae]|uniref:conjugative transfer signal peptidase TraF n=1 Tax=Devosia neptuniae TaxID=191302 RepID=UPI0022AF11F3|nr:conjugative transfer signal peptidase TraF [Devosia neptuniae]MCZ4348011.1 conjugative transfer signal peptidase TraF [Devosia neptuniae]
MSKQRPVAIVTLTIGIGVVAALAALGFFGGLRLNLTPSYPLGIWRIGPLDRAAAVGDRVFICPPDGPAFVLGQSRGYLPNGLCPSGLAPLIKTIVAIAGQSVAVGPAVTIDGVIVPSSVVRASDVQGRPLPRFSGGRVPANAVFVFSPFGGSYDSRYFGPISADGILGLAMPVLVLAR